MKSCPHWIRMWCQASCSFHQQIGLKFKAGMSKMLHLQHRFLQCWKWTLRKVDQKYLEMFGMWYWRRVENISWIDSVRNEVLHRAKEERNILHTRKRRKTNCIISIIVQRDASFSSLLFTARSLYMFRVSLHPSSGMAFGNVGGRSLLRYSWPRWNEVAAPIIWPVPEAVVTILWTPDDGCDETRNM